MSVRYKHSCKHSWARSETHRLRRQLGFWSAALLSLAMLTGLAPEAEAQNPQVPIILEYPAFNPIGRVDEGDAVEFTVRRVGDTSQELTVNVRIEGVSEITYNPTDADDFDSSKTTSSLTIAAGDTTPQTITVQTTQNTPIERHERFEVVASGTYDGADFEERLEGRLFDAVRATVDLTYTDPFRITEGETGTVTFTTSEIVPHAVNVGYSIMSRHTTSTETVGDGGATMADHNVRSGTVTIPANTGSATFDVQTVEDSVPEPEEQFVVIFTPRGNVQDGSPSYNQVDTFTGDTVNFRPKSVVVTIVDDDPPQQQQRFVYLHGTVSGGLTGTTRATLDEGKEATLTVTLVGDPPTSDVSIPLKFTGFPVGEATSSDYRIPASVTIKSGQKSGSVELEIVDDSLDERRHEILAVEINDSTGSWPQGYTKGDRSRFEVVMRDNDKTPASLGNLSRTALTEATGARTATFQVNVARRPKGGVTGMTPFASVNLAEGRATFALGYTGTAERGLDYRSATSITIPESSASLPGNCSPSGEAVVCTVTLTVTDDNLYEGGSGQTENVKIDLGHGIARATGYKSLGLTIEDNDLQPTFSIADASGSEAGNVTFTVTRSGAPGNDVSVTAATGSHVGATNPATAGTDYTAKTESLRFKADDSQETFQVAVTDDNFDEPDETFAVTLSGPVDNDRLPAPGIAAGGGTATGTITDNDPAPVLSIDNPSVTEGDTTPATLTFTVTLAPASGKTVTVNYADRLTGTATSATDYTALTSGTLTFAPGDTAKTIDVTVAGDTADEPDETVVLRLSSPADATLSGDAATLDATGTITDNDPAPVLSIDNPSVTEGDTTPATLTFTVTLAPASGKTVTVNYADRLTGTATSATDYTALTSGTLTFAPGDTAKTIDVTVAGDTADEPDETVVLLLSSPADATLSGDAATLDATGTITDNDPAPVLSIKNVLLGYEGDEGVTNLTHRVTLSPASGRTVTVKYADTGTGTATSGEGGDYATLSSGTLSFAPGETSKFIRIKANGDTDYEPDETIIVRLSEPVNATLSGGKNTLDATGWIENDDAPPAPTINPGDTTVEEGETAIFTVSRKHDFEEITVFYGTSPGSADTATNDAATSGSDYTAYAADSTAVFREGEDEITLEFETVDDDLHEAPEDFTVTIGSGDYSEDYTVTISDNDDLPTATLALASSSISEKGGRSRVTASLDLPTSRELRLAVSTTPTDPAVAGDIEQTGQWLTIPAGTTTSTGVVALTGVDNNVDAPDKTITVSALLFGNADIDDPGDQTLILTDDDTRGITVSAATSGLALAEADDPVTTQATENEATYTVVLDSQPTDTVTVNLESEDTDVATVAPASLTFTTGNWSTAQTVTVTGVADIIDNPNDRRTVDITHTVSAAATDYASETADAVTVTVTDDDAAPGGITLTVDTNGATAGTPDTVAEGAGATEVTVRATVDGATRYGTAQTVTVSVGGGTATTPADYATVANFTITIPAGAAGHTETFTLTPADDALDEPDETVTVTGVLAGSTVTSATVTLTDNDAPPSFSITAAEADEGEAVVFTAQPPDQVRGRLSPSRGEGVCCRVTLRYSGLPIYQPAGPLIFRGFDDVVFKTGTAFGQQPVRQHFTGPFNRQVRRKDPDVRRGPDRAMVFR